MGGVNEKPQTRELTEDQRKEFRAVLAEAIRVIEDEGVPYVVAGSLASNVWGRPTSTGDIDFVIDPTDAKRVLKRFDAAGFQTEETQPQWLYKAKRGDVTVDLIFELQGHLYLDEAMADRAVVCEVEETKVRLISAEDFVVSQAIAFEEDTPDYWFHALGVLAKKKLDWDYLIERASAGPRRVLSVLLFAQANDLAVPDKVIRSLFDTYLD